MVVQILIPTSDPENPLGNQLRHRVLDAIRIAMILEASREGSRTPERSATSRSRNAVEEPRSGLTGPASSGYRAPGEHGASLEAGSGGAGFSVSIC